MQHVSGTAVGQTDSNLKLRKPQSASRVTKAVEKEKLVATAKNLGKKSAPEKANATTKTTRSAADKKGSIKQHDTLPQKGKEAAAPKKVAKQPAAAPGKGKINSASVQKKAKKEKVVVPEIKPHPVAPAVDDQRKFISEGSIDSGVAARVAEARKNLPEPGKKEFNFATVRRLKEFFKKIFDIF